MATVGKWAGRRWRVLWHTRRGRGFSEPLGKWGHALLGTSAPRASGCLQGAPTAWVGLRSDKHGPEDTLPVTQSGALGLNSVLACSEESWQPR